jgi:hypothetical protein
MRKFLFLDIDGILNSQEWCKKIGGYGFPPMLAEPATKGGLLWDERMVNRVRRIVEETGSQIVISSSWRGYGEHAITKWQEMFAVYGWKDAPVIGETPRSSWARRTRGEEISEWLDENLGMEVFQFAILDDDSDFEPWQPLVQTSNETGLQEEHVQACLALLRESGDSKAGRGTETDCAVGP